jgi:hypothetical protein
MRIRKSPPVSRQEKARNYGETAARFYDPHPYETIHGTMTAPTNNPNISARNATAEAISTIPDTRFTDISVL